ncbi:class I SAM-dependent methyltransferase [Geobacter sulfurreducens]|uniref:class I SAM-dependent methyltransferase n=1 Tax=Geobacter sulfurreducens TaxID=35554 RepID=UPI0020B77306|nr:class I SAM-dependent methyltransferase [Geobacter sulfurreducens]UTG92336.1 class I SAM-dependent methyltransferase [Geobacter sulfurreducens]
MSHRPCPVCSGTAFTPLFDATIDDFDGTIFDQRILVASCLHCGFGYNICDFSSSSLEEHYQSEALYQTETGFGVGGTTPADLARYERYYQLLKPYLAGRERCIVDVGCSKGGFLAFLRQKGQSQVLGVELDPICASYARSNHGLDVLDGSANAIPLPDGKADILIYSHVLEHLDDPSRALAETRRVLTNDGIVFIEVPDALHYAEAKLFDFFHWFGMREHINHFDSAHLSMLMNRAGFDTLATSEAIVSPYQSTLTPESRHSFPMLAGIFRKGTSAVSHQPDRNDALSASLRHYISSQQELIDKHRQRIEELAKSQRPLFVWGIALEFFCVYSFGQLKKCNIRALVDRSELKQTKTVNGITVVPPEALQKAPADAAIVITSSFHADAMLEYLEQINFKGDVVVFR